MIWAAIGSMAGSMLFNLIRKMVKSNDDLLTVPKNKDLPINQREYLVTSKKQRKKEKRISILIKINMRGR